MGVLRPSYHVPQRGGWVCEPYHSPRIVARVHPLFCGFVSVSGDAISLEIHGGPIPKSIRNVGDVEIVEYSDEIAHHGTKDALIAEGICTEGDLSFERSHWAYLSGSDNLCLCFTNKLPDGTFVHWRETEEACQRRIDEREYEGQRPSSILKTIQPAVTDQVPCLIRNQAAIASVDAAFRRFIDLAIGASANPQA